MKILIITSIGIGLLILGYSLIRNSILPLGGHGGSNVIDSALFSQNGIITFSYRTNLNTATTTACAIQAPAATSTIVHASIDIRTGTSTANLIEIGKDVGNAGTSTLLAKLSLASSARGTLVATSTLDTSDNLIIAPLNWVVVKWLSYGSTRAVGNCEVIFRVVS